MGGSVTIFELEITYFYPTCKGACRIKTLYVPLLLLSFIVGCNSSGSTEEQPPDLVGEIEETNNTENTVLISGSGEISDKDTQVILSITSESEILDENKNILSLDDIKPEMKVGVWIDNRELLDTEPRQGVLELLKVLGE